MRRHRLHEPGNRAIDGIQPDDRVAAEVGGTWIGDDRSLNTSVRGIAFTSGAHVIADLMLKLPAVQFSGPTSCRA